LHDAPNAESAPRTGKLSKTLDDRYFGRSKHWMKLENPEASGDGLAMEAFQ